MGWSEMDLLRNLAKGDVRILADPDAPAPMAVSLIVPFPPTTNHLYTVAGGRKRLSQAGQDYQKRVGEIWWQQRPQGWRPLQGRLHLVLEFHAPTDRDYDISNFVKCLEDALTKAGVYLDDSQIDHNEQRRKAPSQPGYVAVYIERLT